MPLIFSDLHQFKRMATNDLEIIHGLKKGGNTRQTSESKLFKTYQYFVSNAVHKYALEEQDLQSVYCDSFMAVVQQILDGRFQGGATLKTFFYRIFSNKCIDAVRKKTTNKASIHQTEWIEDWHHLSNKAANALKSIINKEMVDEVKQAFKQIGEKCNAILTAWSKGYSAQEISDNLGYKSPQSVRTTKSRCMEKLLATRKQINS